MPAPSRLRNVSSSVALVAGCLAFGAAIGWMAVYLFTTEPLQGWNDIRRASGALVVGGVLGGLAGIYLARDLSSRARWWSTAVTALLTAGTLWSLDLTAR